MLDCGVFRFIIFFAQRRFSYLVPNIGSGPQKAKLFTGYVLYSVSKKISKWVFFSIINRRKNLVVKSDFDRWQHWAIFLRLRIYLAK